MAYQIRTTAGTTLATIADGTTNSSTTSLTLIGKNFPGYGNLLNENFVKLLENFANNTTPANPVTGQLWFDSASLVLKVYNGSQWKTISSSASGTSQPVNPIQGDLWYDSENAQLKVWSSSAWILVGPTYSTSSGTTGALVETIADSSIPPNNHVVIKFYISNAVAAILSLDATFTPSVSINGFTTIKPGMNLVSAAVVSGAQYSGSVPDADTVGGLAASQFLRKDANDNNGAFTFTAGTLAVTGTTTLNGAATLNSVTVANASTFSSNVTVAGKILPNTTNSLEIGTSGSVFANVWATNFRGTAITAQYADLAERFEADIPMIPGTVVELGGVKEITSAVQELSEAVFGVISTRAGFLMNGSAGNDQTHPPVAVNGRVPVRVIGKINKGDRLVSAGNGIARAATRSEMTAFNVIGRALNDKVTDGDGTVEAIVKLNS